MEVHAHTHTEEKNGHTISGSFSCYSLLCLLASLQKIKESILSEHQREKKFARRLLSDLQQDSLFFETRIQLLEKRQQAHEQFLKIMTNPAGATDSAVNRGFVRILLLTETSNDFITATYNQMKTSGSLRYIDNDSLTTSLQQYYDVLLAKLSAMLKGLINSLRTILFLI
jgi:hypothetical protein